MKYIFVIYRNDEIYGAYVSRSKAEKKRNDIMKMLAAMGDRDNRVDVEPIELDEEN